MVGGTEARRLRINAPMTYDEGLLAQMSGIRQELDDKSINDLNNYCDSAFNASKGNYSYKDIK